jgi:hypothetical protein
MRELVRAAIIGDSTLNLLGIDGTNAFAVDVDTPQTRPFLQLRWGRTDQGIGPVNTRTLVIWAHDQPGDYAVIDSILMRLRGLLLGLVGESNGPGWLVDATWIGDSEDLADDGHGTITRNASFTLVGSGQ